MRVRATARRAPYTCDVPAQERDAAGRPLVMHEVRGELRLGRVFEAETTYPHDPSPQEAKAGIRKLLGLG